MRRKHDLLIITPVEYPDVAGLLLYVAVLSSTAVSVSQ